jgi:glucose-1-phosphatase
LVERALVSTKAFFLFFCGMIDQQIDTLIFDFGGVLINIDYQRTIDAFKDFGMLDFEERYSQAAQSTLFNDFETGKISTQRFINELLQNLPAGISANRVVQAWNAMILDVPTASVDLLKSLQGSYRLFLLSNTNEIHLPKAMNEWSKVSQESFDAQFERAYYSHQIGMRKPNRDIFDFVCTKNAIDPKTALFLDDSIQHVLGARAAGLHAIHLTSDKPLSSVFS